MSARHSLHSHALVALQFSAIAVIAWPFVDPSMVRLPWLAISAAGVLAGLYTLMHNRLGNFDVYPEPLPNACLVTSGPYRWIRHPMYSSLLLMMLGIAIYYHALPNYAGLALLAVAVFGKIRLEERHLHLRFEDYSAYVERTHRLIPKVY
jgi:protein-S-isoprenylcysteine O-methyltransferase Ste14